MPTSIAHVRTELPRRYMSQLCKHFEHKLPVTLADDHGEIVFPNGRCILTTSEGVLAMQVQAPDAESLVTTEGVVARHLLRFAFREPPAIVWEAVGADQNK